MLYMPSSTLFAKNKKADSFLKPSMFIVMAVCLLLVLLSIFYFQNYFATFSLFLATFFLMYSYWSPTKEIKIAISDNGLSVNETPNSWNKIIKWDKLDSEEYIEITLATKNVSQPYVNWYFLKTNYQSIEIFESAMQYYKIPREDGMATKDNFQNLLRILGLR
jgi:hypothetical protein